MELTKDGKSLPKRTRDTQVHTFENAAASPLRRFAASRCACPQCSSRNELCTSYRDIRFTRLRQRCNWYDCGFLYQLNLVLSAVATLLQLLRLWFSLPNKPSRDLTVAYLVNKATRGAARTQVSTFKATKAWGHNDNTHHCSCTSFHHILGGIFCMLVEMQHTPWWVQGKSGDTHRWCNPRHYTKKWKSYTCKQTKLNVSTNI